MIVPSFDIVAGSTVQLVGGEEHALDAGDPRPLLERFGVVGEVAVVDIDAARGEGDNRDLIGELCTLGSIRVGGGIRSTEQATEWLDAGASKVIVGTAASDGFLAELPRERVIVALDAREQRVVTHGWRKTSDSALLDLVRRYQGLCGGLLVTFVEREGRMEGTDMDLARDVVAAAEDTPVTIAGGITTAEEIAELDRIGADAQVGMALYAGRLGLADALAAPMTSDRADGLWPTVVVDERGVALGLAWSDTESLARAIDARRGVYQSRSRGLWVKGETSGAVQELLAVDLDCDRDALRFTVRQTDGFCHTGTMHCWGDDRGLSRLQRRLETLAADRPVGSNTVKLLDDESLLRSKLVEEAAELGDPRADVASEAADLFYFALTRLVAAGVSIDSVERVLDQRERRVTRRPMAAKKKT